MMVVKRHQLIYYNRDSFNTIDNPNNIINALMESRFKFIAKTRKPINTSIGDQNGSRHGRNFVHTQKQVTQYPLKKVHDTKEACQHRKVCSCHYKFALRGNQSPQPDRLQAEQDEGDEKQNMPCVPTNALCTHLSKASLTLPPAPSLNT